MTQSVNLETIRNSIPDWMKNTPEAQTETVRETNPEAFVLTLCEYDFAEVKKAHGMEAPEADEALNRLAIFCAFSVLKKLYRVSAQPVIADLIRSIRSDLADIDRLDYSIEHATVERVHINTEGETVSETAIVDSNCNKAVADLVKTAHGDGLDVVNTAVVALMEEAEKAKNRAPLACGWVETPYTVRRLKAHVYIRAEESVGGWENVETTPIQEVYRAIRRYIETTRQVQTANAKYTYLDTEVTDPKTGETDVMYRRLPMYSNLAGDVTDSNENTIYPTTAKPKQYVTADGQTVAEYDEIVSALNLTDRQTAVLKYRMSGYGYQAIATAMGIQERLVRRTVKQIQVKLYDMGIHPDNMTERPEAK